MKKIFLLVILFTIVSSYSEDLLKLNVNPEGKFILTDFRNNIYKESRLIIKISSDSLLEYIKDSFPYYNFRVDSILTTLSNQTQKNINDEDIKTYKQNFSLDLNFRRALTDSLFSINKGKPFSDYPDFDICLNDTRLRKNVDEYTSGIIVNNKNKLIIKYNTTYSKAFSYLYESKNFTNLHPNSKELKKLKEQMQSIYLRIKDSFENKKSSLTIDSTEAIKKQINCFLDSLNVKDAITSILDDTSNIRIKKSILGYINDKQGILVSKYLLDKSNSDFILRNFGLLPDTIEPKESIIKLNEDKKQFLIKLNEQKYLDSLRKCFTKPIDCDSLKILSNIVNSKYKKTDAARIRLVKIAEKRLSDSALLSITKTALYYFTESIMKEISKIDSRIKQINDSITIIKKLQQVASVKEIIVNDLNFYYSGNEKKELVSMRFHDYDDKLNLQDNAQKNNVTWYDNNEKIKNITYNIPEPIIIKYSETPRDTDFTTNILTDKIKSPLEDLAKAINNADYNGIANSFPFANENGSDSKKECPEIFPIFNKFMAFYSLVDWFTSLNKIIEPKASIKLYHSQVDESKHDNTKSRVIDYSLAALNNDSSNTTLKKNNFTYYFIKKKYVDISTMVAFNLTNKNNPREVTSYNEDNQKFKTTTYKPVDVAAGIKIYPFGINPKIWWPKVKNFKVLLRRGESCLNRVSIFVGLGLNQQQLKNYFIGAGYEIVPGLGVNVGLNGYLDKKFKLENGEVISDKYVFKPSTYLGITVDPIILLQVSNIIKK